VRYLAIARGVVSEDEKDEFDERSRPLTAAADPAPLSGDDSNNWGEDRPAAEVVAKFSLDPPLRWVPVNRGPVQASKPPADWDGSVPAGCGVLLCCRMLGPCQHFAQHGHCWAEGAQP